MRGAVTTLLVGILVLWPAAEAAGQILTENEQAMLEALWNLGIDPERLGKRYDPSWVVEDVQRQLVERWAAGDESAVAEVSHFRQVVLEVMLGEPVTPWLIEERYGGSSGWGRPSSSSSSSSSSSEALPGVPCLLRATSLTVEELAEVDSAALFALATFFRSAYASQMRPPRRVWLAGLSKWSFYHWTEWLATLADPESKAAQTFGLRPEAVDETVLQWLLMADLLERMKIYQAGAEARDLYHRVLELRPENKLALYRAGFLDERYGDYARSARSFGRLLDLSPADSEVRLRLGVNLGRSGATVAAAAETLRHVFESDAAPWMQIVAVQELARIQATARPAMAQTTLEEAIERFPGAWRLKLQLAGLQLAGLQVAGKQVDAWSTASQAVRGITGGWETDAGDSARIRYERARDDEILAARHQYLEVSASHREVLRSAFHTLEQLRQGDAAYFERRQRFRDCEGAITENVLERLVEDPPPPRMP